MKKTGLGKDEDENDADEEARLLRDRPHSAVAHDPDGESRAQSAYPAGDAGSQVGKRRVERIVLARPLHSS